MIETDDDNSTSLQRYLRTSMGSELMKMHSLSDYGVWVITGEADAGMHSGPGPQLGIVQGKLEDVIEYGTSLADFYNWGNGGTFKFLGESLPVINSDYIQARKRLLKDEADLVAQLALVRELLGTVR